MTNVSDNISAMPFKAGSPKKEPMSPLPAANRIVSKAPIVTFSQNRALIC